MIFIITASLIGSLIVFPMVFNFLFLWNSGLSRGSTSDWFTLYGNITGGLIGGAITYFSLVKTLSNEREKMKNMTQKELENKDQEMKRIEKVFIINSKYFLERIYNNMVLIRNVTDDEYKEQISQIASSNEIGLISFSELGFEFDESKIDMDKYKIYLKNIDSYSYEFMTYLKECLPNFVDNKELYDSCLDLYLLMEFLNDDFSSAGEMDYYKDVGFLYNFMEDYDIGYSSVIRLKLDEVGQEWDKKVSDSSFPSALQNIRLPHVSY